MLDSPDAIAADMEPRMLLSRLKPAAETAINTNLKALIETKHLYQSFNIETVLAEIGVHARSEQTVAVVKRELQDYVSRPWRVEPALLQGGPPVRRITDRPDMPHVAVDTVKLFCGTCRRTEPYNLVYTEDLYEEMQKHGVRLHRDQAIQSLVLSYECQSCKQMPEVFVLSRRGLKVTLVGRSPMEQVQVPPVIPKTHSKFYSDAIVAYQSGQVLPALFMLRTFIEQFARHTVAASSSLRADEVLDQYMASIPDPVRAHFPSPRDVYSRLSAALHSASPDGALYERSAKELEQHFDARRLYGLASV